MARKAKADAAASGKIKKVKSNARSTSARPRRSSSLKKPALEKIAAEAAPVTANSFDPTEDQIQTRAYFISERRRRFDLPGDANTDWLEARRQLLSEIGPR